MSLVEGLGGRKSLRCGKRGVTQYKEDKEELP